ncbi:hypothetical protein ANANG_G00076080 [Anguilla anguilla]|uniref:Exocyst complex component 2 n=1 Tax=Anguilla anguilla TaxID=7936 RepID=A0A9D3MM62_ANGAN|nr:hypothetical protein ANANG_G00076080 [Anguilla anguilla]
MCRSQNKWQRRDNAMATSWPRTMKGNGGPNSRQTRRSRNVSVTSAKCLSSTRTLSAAKLGNCNPEVDVIRDIRGQSELHPAACSCNGSQLSLTTTMSRSRQPPLVTGISPNEGAPWTKVTIRGENLGTGPADLIGLSICGHNCLLTAEWMSGSKIVCRVGPAKDDKGEIIVSTKSGGNGTSTVSFKLLKTEKIGILDQSAVWVDEMNYYDMRTDRNKGISPLSLRPANPLGIDIDKSKVAQKDLESMFPGMSGDFTSENFSATWYLIENHSSTSFEQLRIAAQNLRKQANKKNDGSLAYVKGAQHLLRGPGRAGSHSPKAGG